MGSKVTGAELEIMEYLWEQDKGMTFADLLSYFNSEKRKDWCKQTLNTCLNRLIKKGLLLKEQSDKKAVYVPKVTQLRYRQLCAQNILNECYGGVLSNFLAALTGMERITEEEKQRLLASIEKEM